jgi:hypothetical protein
MSRVSPPWIKRVALGRDTAIAIHDPSRTSPAVMAVTLALHGSPRLTDWAGSSASAPPCAVPRRRFASTMRPFPAAINGPVESPPGSRHRPEVYRSRRLRGVPCRVFAPHVRSRQTPGKVWLQSVQGTCLIGPTGGNVRLDLICPPGPYRPCTALVPVPRRLTGTCLLTSFHHPLHIIGRKMHHEVFDRRACRHDPCTERMVEPILRWQLRHGFVKRHRHNHGMEVIWNMSPPA